MVTQLQNVYNCVADALDVLIEVFDSLNMKFAGVTIDLRFLVGTAIVLMIYHHILGVDETEEEYKGFSYYDDEEY